MNKNKAGCISMTQEKESSPQSPVLVGGA